MNENETNGTGNEVRRVALLIDADNASAPYRHEIEHRARMNGGTASSESWRGLIVAPEHRCSPYDRKRDYPARSRSSRTSSATWGHLRRYSPLPPWPTDSGSAHVIHGLDVRNLKGDVFGGLTAAVVALPLALAFGVASGAGPVAGVYGAIFGAATYAANVWAKGASRRA